MKSMRIKLRLYKAFVKHPNLSWLGLKLGNFIYTAGLVGYVLHAYPFLSLETIAGLAIGLPLFMIVSERIDKLFGR